MYEYEIFIEDINPCGGEQYSKKTLIEAEAASPEAYVKENGRLIVPLYAELLKQSESSKAIALKKGVKFEGTIILQSDKDAAFSLVKKVLYTAGRAGYNDIKFAAVKQ